MNGGYLNCNNPNQMHNSGHQYEVLLKERADLLQTIEAMQVTVDNQRKEINDQKSLLANLKMLKADLTDDLDDSKQALATKESMVLDLKETLARQNHQIE